MRIRPFEKNALPNNNYDMHDQRETGEISIAWVNKPKLPKHLDASNMKPIFPNLFVDNKKTTNTYPFDPTACHEGCDKCSRLGCIKV